MYSSAFPPLSPRRNTRFWISVCPQTNWRCHHIALHGTTLTPTSQVPESRSTPAKLDAIRA
eukprot:1924989-Rhodomonas_salina.2